MLAHAADDLLRASWPIVAFEPFQEPASTVNVCCDRGLLQPGRTQLMLEAAELRAKLCKRKTLAASRGYLWSRRDSLGSRSVCTRQICRRRWDPASGGQYLQRRTGCVNGEGK